MAALVIAVANTKGGCGKTTIATNLAAVFAKRGLRTLVVDADPQQTIMKRRSMFEHALPFDVRPHPYANIHTDLVKQIQDYDVVFIDCPPGEGKQTIATAKVANITRTACLAAHAVIVPVRPTPYDYDASVGMVELFQDIAVYRPGLSVFVVINGKPPMKTRTGAEAIAVAKESFVVEGLSCRVLNTEIHTRQAFADAPGVGKTVIDYDPNSKAAEEISQLGDEVYECLSLNAQA